MATRITSANGVYDLSEVKTLKDLREEIGFIRTSLKKDEEELEARLYRMPQEALKATADAVLPGFLNRMIANGSWKILASGAGLLANPFSKKYSFSKSIVSGAKRLGLVALMRGAYNLWKSKRASAQTPVVSSKIAAPVKKVPPPKSK